MNDKIIIKGAKVHNLKNIDLELPRNKLIVFTGVSGSGKSSLAFDTIFAEGQRRYVESLSPYARQFLGQMDAPDVEEITGLSPAIAIDQKGHSHNPRSTVATLTEIYDYMRVLFARLGKPFCPMCGGEIKKLSSQEMIDTIINEFPAKSAGGAITILAPVVRGRKGEYYQLLYDLLSDGFKDVRIDGKFYSLHERINLSRYKAHNIDLLIDKVLASDISRLAEAVESALDYGKGLLKVLIGDKEIILSSKWSCPKDDFAFSEIEPRLFSFNSPYGACENCHGLGREVIWSEEPCPKCQGTRLKKEALSVKVGNKNIAEISALTIDNAYEFFVTYEDKLKNNEKEISKTVLKEIISRLSFLLEVGLDYIALNREAGTLSGGESQRIRLASQIGSKLSGTLYVLDEPTIGLHERDNERLLKTLKNLRDLGNTVIVVEHDEKTIHESDFLVDLGPGPGRHGGEVVVAGETQEMFFKKKSPPIKLHAAHKSSRTDMWLSPGNSLTLKYLKGEEKIEIPEIRRTNTNEKIKIIGASANNLKNINVDIPLRRFVCVTGVSGSGKSTLVFDILSKGTRRGIDRIGNETRGVSKVLGFEYLDSVIEVDQSPIGRTPRSNPSTYTGVFTPIRDLFASLPEAKEKSYGISRFSFNRPGGRCEACEGAGSKLIEMHFLPPVLVTCDVCRGKRFNNETLDVEYKGKNIADVLNLTVEEALNIFEDIYTISDKLKVLNQVGLGYIRLGQSATTLSGGEAQRIKLAKYLARPMHRRSLFLLDEPTTGLHFEDIKMLLKVLDELVKRGNTVLVIEHNLHVIKCADYVIDLGPEGGDRGGKLIAHGTPEEVAKNKNSYTGQYLKKILYNIR